MKNQPIIFCFAESLTVKTVGLELNRFLNLLYQQTKAVFVLDLNQVLVCDSAGIALLIEIKRLCTRDQHKMRIKNMPCIMQDLSVFLM